MQTTKNDVYFWRSFPLSEVIANGETIEVEFKDDRKNFSDYIIYEAVVALTNTLGGVILVGVDNDRAVTGCRRIADGTWKSTNAVAGMIMANTVPACATAVSLEHFNGKKILAIQVPKSPTTTGTKSGKFLKRILDSQGKPQNIPMTADDIVSGASRVGVQDFSSMVLAGAHLVDLDLDLVDKVAKRRATQITDSYQRETLNKTPEEVLAAAGLWKRFNERGISIFPAFQIS